MSKVVPFKYVPFKAVRNQDLYNCFTKSLEYNELAKDYIKTQIFDIKNKLGFNPDDEILKEDLKVAEYINHTLLFLEDSYKEGLKSIGVYVK